MDSLVENTVFDDDRAIEVDGMAHHVDVDRFRRDRRRQNALVALGWTVLRFWDGSIRGIIEWSCQSNVEGAITK